MKLATSTQMQLLDQVTINEIGIPGIVLMENAGKETVNQMEAAFGPVCHKTVIIFIGPGNNGGDGLVIGRHILQRGGVPYLVYLVPPEKLGGDAAINASVCEKLQIQTMTVLDEEDIATLRKNTRDLHFSSPVHSLVDGLFGSGLKRTLEGRFATVVQVMNGFAHSHNLPVVAVDIPSGLSGDTGEIMGYCVRANLTVTYGLAQPGHFLHGGEHVGRLKVIDISIPNQVVEEASLPGRILDHSTGNLLHPRNKATHKGSFGHLLIVAGSEGKTGAAILAAQAALRSGCGLVTMAVPADLHAIFETSLPEAMTVALPSSTRYFSSYDYTLLQEIAENKDAVVLGPGLGTNADTGKLVHKLYSELALPMVVDADALNLLAMEPDCINKPAEARILTPHPGEMSRLINKSTAEIQKDRIQAASWLSKEQVNNNNEIITVLKGAGTVLSTSANSSCWAINSSGNSGMATGGMGDVLAGLIGGLLVQDYAPWDAAQVGTYAHGLAADILAEKQSHGFLASEVAAALPLAMAKMLEPYKSYEY